MPNSLIGVSSITKAMLIEQLTANLISFFDWGLLSIGAFLNVHRTNQARALLRPVTSPGITPGGHIWQSTKANWVWETGVPFTPTPLLITGIYVNNSFLANDGTNYYVNYRDGLINFNLAQPPTNTVEVEYAYKKYNLYSADVEWFQEVIFDPSNVPGILDKNKIYLPAVIVEVLPSSRLKPFQLGDYSVVQAQDVLFHILAESPEDRNRMVDILTRQLDNVFWLYDLNKVAANNAFPLTVNGSLVASPMNYPQFIASYPWTKCKFAAIQPQEISRQLPLVRAVVRTTLEVDLIYH
jgi:hypothetical protein